VWPGSFGLAAITVRAIDLRYLQRWAQARRRPALRLMGADEIYLGKKKFLKVVDQPIDGRTAVLWAGAKARDARRVFPAAPERLSTKCDSGGLCGHVGAMPLEQWCHNAVYDKFHILQHAGQAVDELRRPSSSAKVAQPTIWYGQALVALRSWLQPGRDKRRHLSALFALNRRILKAYLLKESLAQLTMNYLLLKAQR